MVNTGIVKAIEKDGRVRVQIYKESACSHCSGCSESSKISREDIFTIDEEVQVGDLISFEIDTKEIMRAALLVYILPIAAMILGYLLGSYLNKNEGTCIAYSFSAFILTFGILFLYDRLVLKKKNKSSIRIKKI
jgi:sigma-E factor negative regulatory protein RseC